MDLFATPGGDDYACIYGVALYEESYAGTFCWKTFQRYETRYGRSPPSERYHQPFQQERACRLDASSQTGAADSKSPAAFVHSREFSVFCSSRSRRDYDPQRASTGSSEHERLDVACFGPALFVLAPGVKTFGVQSGENRICEQTPSQRSGCAGEVLHHRASKSFPDRRETITPSAVCAYVQSALCGKKRTNVLGCQAGYPNPSEPLVFGGEQTDALSTGINVVT